MNEDVRPGIASRLNRKSGTQNAWITSSESRMIFTVCPSGSTIWGPATPGQGAVSRTIAPKYNTETRKGVKRRLPRGGLTPHLLRRRTLASNAPETTSNLPFQFVE